MAAPTSTGTMSEPGFAAPRTRPITKTPPSPCGKSALRAKFNQKHLDESIGRWYRNAWVAAGTGAMDVSSNSRSGGCDHVLLR
jgi:hypothetical protein